MLLPDGIRYPFLWSWIWHWRSNYRVKDYGCLSCQGSLAVVETILICVLTLFSDDIRLPFFDLEFVEGQVQGQRSWICKQLREARSNDLGAHFGWFGCTCWRNFWKICSTPSFDLESDLAGQTPCQMLWLCKLLREASYHSRTISYVCRPNFRTISSTLFIDLEFDLEVQMPGQRSVVQAAHGS